MLKKSILLMVFALIFTLSVIEAQAQTVRNNRISYEMPFGLRYERMLNTQISTGMNAYATLNILSENVVCGVCIFTRYYPSLNQTFFIGLGIGLHTFIPIFGNYYLAGLSLSPELGWRIRFGQSRFFLPLGLNAPIVFDPLSPTIPWVNLRIISYIGLGVAF